MTGPRVTISEHIERALVALRLARELGMNVPVTRDALARVSSAADHALERRDYTELPEAILAELSGVVGLGAEDAERALDDVLRGLGVPTPGPSRELELIEEVISAALTRAAGIDRFEDAVPELATVTALVGQALRVSMGSGLPLTSRLDNLVRDFDHADEPGMLGAIHADLRAGTYPGLA